MCAKFRFSTIIYAEVMVKKWLNSVRKPTNSSAALCAELLGTSKAPKRVVNFIFLSPVAISAMQPKYGRHSPLAY